ncbi:ATP-binding protein [Bacillus altitudinis]|uniref:ATP-binding protein n=1 Tax=Bacillus altitudinis TaxID=293387 RepID=UPI00228321FE|nr:ATP-binding protein [Bacillus altitudinis]MCY7696334.1 ATP-binding protein [Bacillus altitudinis]
MRRLIDKVFKDHTVDRGFQSLPLDLSYKEVEYRTKRGFLARKLCYYTGTKVADGEDVFYRSLVCSVCDEKSDGQEYFLFMSEQMLTWAKEKEHNIRENILRMNVKTNFQNAMLKAYEIFKEDLLAPEKSGAAPQSSKWEEWKVYRDVILASTQGKFLLASEEELVGFKKGRIFCEGEIKQLSDIPNCRHRARNSLEAMGYKNSTTMGWLLVLSEAITNTIKHGEEGKMTLIEDKDQNEIRFIIEDRGPGFSLKELPKMTLLAGYSTKKSMGQGFTLMMKMSKQVSLYTTSEGSTIILTFNREEFPGDVKVKG